MLFWCSGLLVEHQSHDASTTSNTTRVLKHFLLMRSYADWRVLLCCVALWLCLCVY